MISFELDGDLFKTPNGWHEVKFRTFLNYLETVAPKMPECLRDTYESEDMPTFWAAMPKKDKANCYDFFARAVGFWCGISKDLIAKSMNLDQLESAFWAIEIDLSIADFKQDDDFVGFELYGKEYLLPKKHMENSTVVEFCEAAQFELNAQDLENGNWLAMLDIMCVICRPKGEDYIYEAENHDLKKRAFKELTMDKILNVAFFLLKLNDTLRDNLLIYSLKIHKEQREAKHTTSVMAGIQ